MLGPDIIEEFDLELSGRHRLTDILSADSPVHKLIHFLVKFTSKPFTRTADVKRMDGVKDSVLEKGSAYWRCSRKVNKILGATCI